VKFTDPGWLVAGAFTCALLFALGRFADARRRAALRQFVSAHLLHELTQSISVARRRVQRGCDLAAVALLCVALAGPQWGYRWEQQNRRGNEIVFAIDTSRSMSTPDVKPTRLARAKLAIDDFASRLDGDAVGIVAFAGSAFLVCPITLDYGAFHESLSAIDTNTIPRGGTNIASAIREAQAALRRRPGSDKILILVTDGEDLEGSALVAAVTAKQQDGLRIFAVGVGTAGGDLIPIPPDQGGGFVKDETGAFVKSRLDEAALTAIATATDGFYVPLGVQGEGLEMIAKSVLGPLAKHDLASRQQRVYIERYQWPLAASLGVLLLSLGMRTRRRQPARRTPAKAAAAASTSSAIAGSLLLLPILLLPLLPLLSLLPILLPTRAGADELNPRPLPIPAASPAASSTAPSPPAQTPRVSSPAAQTHAASAFSASNPLEAYNAGTTAYRAGQFPQAAEAFQQSISHAPSSDAARLSEQQDAYYNLGNSLYRAGQKTEKGDATETLKKWNDAVKAYDTALQLRAGDADSKYNRDLVKRKIEALQQQQQNQNQNQKQQQPPNQGQSQNQSPPPNSGQGQGQSPPPEQGQPPPGASSQQAQGQPPPQSPGQQPPQDPPPQSAGQPPQNADQSPKPSPGGQPKSDAQEQSPEDTRAADNQHPAGQMSREEARELLDSVKGDERRPPGIPLARRSEDEPPPDRPVKNW
jgi:Ca-activated chloride channel family protein